MKLLICGDRNWTDKEAIKKVILDIKPDFIIEGECKGADLLAKDAARELGFKDENILKFPADWGTYGKAAGPIRNSQMLREGKPDVVVGFHYDIEKSKGTKHMLTISKINGTLALLHDGNELKEFK
jgi:hypothetical protein